MSITRLTLEEARRRVTSRMLSCLRKTKDKDIDYSEIPELDDNFWHNAARRAGRPPKAVCKDMLNLRVDHFDLLALRRSGRGWQTRVSSWISEGIRKGVL